MSTFYFRSFCFLGRESARGRSTRIAATAAHTQNSATAATAPRLAGSNATTPTDPPAPAMAASTLRSRGTRASPHVTAASARLAIATSPLPIRARKSDAACPCSNPPAAAV